MSADAASWQKQATEYAKAHAEYKRARLDIQTALDRQKMIEVTLQRLRDKLIASVGPNIRVRNVVVADVLVRVEWSPTVIADKPQVSVIVEPVERAQTERYPQPPTGEPTA